MSQVLFFFLALGAHAFKTLNRLQYHAKSEQLRHEIVQVDIPPSQPVQV